MFLSLIPNCQVARKLLLDDYVKFIRFAQRRIELTGYGILAFITNHGYVDNPTFRGMRQSLFTIFDEIYILDLHGSARKKDVTPNGDKDENVFDIQQGVAIILAIKNKQTPNTGQSKIMHSNLWGSRESKYSILNQATINSLDWKQSYPQAPFYLFTPQNLDTMAEYDSGWKVTDVFLINSTGMKTHRDHFVYDFDNPSLVKRIMDFRDLSISDNKIEQTYGLNDTRDWKLHKRRESLNKNQDWQKYFVNCLFRAFDVRRNYYHSDVVELPRQDSMRHLVGFENIALCTNRQVNSEFRHSLCTQYIIDSCTLSGETREVTYIFPLYLYTKPEETIGTLFTQVETSRCANISPGFLQALSEKLGSEFVPDGTGNLKTTFGPEDVFDYVYAVLHSPTYRTRYAEFLKIDFPRLPLTSNKELFFKLAGLGKELVDLHLLRSPKVEDFITSYPISGNNHVEKVQFIPDPMTSGRQEGFLGRVSINPIQYFGDVPEEVWNFKVGGYQVCEKWLKDRKGRTLSGEDISHYQRVVVALKETIRLMQEIDQAIPGWPVE